MGSTCPTLLLLLPHCSFGDGASEPGSPALPDACSPQADPRLQPWLLTPPLVMLWGFMTCARLRDLRGCCLGRRPVSAGRRASGLQVMLSRAHDRRNMWIRDVRSDRGLSSLLGVKLWTLQQVEIPQVRPPGAEQWRGPPRPLVTTGPSARAPLSCAVRGPCPGLSGTRFLQGQNKEVKPSVVCNLH